MLSLCAGLRRRLVVLQVGNDYVQCIASSGHLVLDDQELRGRILDLFALESQLLPLSSCFESNLNGEYHTDPTDNDYYRGIIWELWKGDYSLKAARMMIRRRDFAIRTKSAVPDP